MFCGNRLLTLVGILVFASHASAQWNEEVLYSFQGGTDGATPIGGVVLDKQGNIYGATVNGGSSSCLSPGQCGTVFELSPPAKKGQPWVETVLYVFKGLTAGDGATPGGGLIADAAGNLYGETAYDGAGPCRLLGGLVGCGTVYELSPPSQSGGTWTETVLYSFQGGSDGYVPTGDLVFDTEGNLYGATQFGGGKGANCDILYGGNCGTVFELSPPQTKGGAWTEQVLHSFSSAGLWSVYGDGAQPNGGLIVDQAGNLYGTTYYGGNSVVCDGGESGTGCGTTFELAPMPGGRWEEKVLHRFDINDGVNPEAGLVADQLDNLYGTTFGGPEHGFGLVFELKKPSGSGQSWNEDVLYEFKNGIDGAYPAAGVAFGPNGLLYGTASGGGTGRKGTLFRLEPETARVTVPGIDVLYSFYGGATAAYPYGNLTFGSSDTIYGVSQFGGTGKNCGADGCGTVYKVWP